MSMKRITAGVLLGLLASSSALFADVEAGRLLAQQRCAACHIVTGTPATMSSPTPRLSW
jgi:mono/diheme cytochrome c family protein